MNNKVIISAAAPKIFIILVSIIIAFLFISVLLGVDALLSSNLLVRIIFLTGMGFLGTLTFILLIGYTGRHLSGTAFGPLCKTLLQEYSLCVRCKGFYAGFAGFSIIFGINNMIYISLLFRITLVPYVFILALATMSVLVHVGLRRFEMVKGRWSLYILGFAFSSSPFLLGSLVVYVTQFA